MKLALLGLWIMMILTIALAVMNLYGFTLLIIKNV